MSEVCRRGWTATRLAGGSTETRGNGIMTHAEELCRNLGERHLSVILDICEGARIAAAEELDVLIEGHEEVRGGEDVLEDDDGEADPVASPLR